ncbi:MAG TPA: hypothetical protein VM286_05515 [Candidatus Thermoplasmatota archaeon]|nr:hypothetical protein [Candidatus Thermoplasmatota archaeon]
MAGGYESEDRQAELDEMRREKEREAREKLEAMRREQAIEEVDAGMDQPEGSLRPASLDDEDLEKDPGTAG